MRSCYKILSKLYSPVLIRACLTQPLIGVGYEGKSSIPP